MPDDASLLLRIRGDAAGAKAAAAETRAAISGLRSQLGSEFSSIQNSGQQVFSSLTDNLNLFVGQRVPLIGGAFLRVTENLRGLGSETGKSEAEIARLNSTIDKLSAASGQSRAQITSFLASFVQLENQAQRDAAAIETFGAATAGQLIPQLEQAGAEMATVASSTEGMAASLGTAVPIIGIAVAAIAALTIGAAELTKSFIELAVSTADWEGKLFDLSQQTGVSVETLSALEAVAETTGGNIESVAQSLVLFQRNLEEAQDSSTKAGKQFRDLGISTKETEQAFRDALRVLAAMPEGFRQTSAAAELFGGRGGKQVLAILKETQGDIDGTIKKLRELNSLVTTDVAKTADQLNDQLAITQRQFRGLQAQIVNDSMPAIIKALQDLSRILKENRETFEVLGKTISVFIEGNLRLIGPAVAIASQWFQTWRRDIDAVKEAYDRLAAVMQIVTGNIPQVNPNAIPPVNQSIQAPQQTQFVSNAATSILGAGSRVSGRGGGGGRAGRNTELQDAIKDAELAERELRQKIAADIAENRNALENQAREIEEFTRRAIELSDQQLNATIDRINAEIAALDKARAKKLISQKDYEQKSRELDIETKEAVHKNNEEIADLEDKRDKQIAAAQIAARERSLRIAEEAADREIASVKYRVDKGLETESEGERKIAALVQEIFRIRKDALEAELNAYGITLERREAINDELIRLDGERAGAAVDASRKIQDALQKEQDALAKVGAEGLKGAGQGVPGRERRPQSAIEQIIEAIDKARSLNPDNTGLIAIQAGVEALAGAFQSLGQAVGQAVEAYVLYGKAGVSIRQVTAQILASVAQQAAVKAIFELAEGFAALALAFFGVPNAGPSAAAHFQAAAIYGAIAGVAAIAGRGIAGNSFNQQTGGAGGGKGTGSSAQESLQTITTGRNQQKTVYVILRADDSKFGQAINAHVVEDIGNSGPIREALLTDGR